MEVASTPEVLESGDRVEVSGRTTQDVAEALALLDAVRRRQNDVARSYEQHLLAAMTDAGIAALPASRAVAAQRLATHKQDLLQQGVYTYATLAGVRGGQESAVRTWASRQQGRLLTLKDGGRTLMPALQFDDAGQLRDEIADLVATLSAAGLDRWQLWSWLASPSGLLSGAVPAEVATLARERASRAAQRYAAELRRQFEVSASSGVAAAAPAHPGPALAHAGSTAEDATRLPRDTNGVAKKRAPARRAARTS